MNECAICLKTDIIEEEICINNCGHNFCKPCIDTWFNRGNNSCPICRQIITYFDNGPDRYRIIFKNNRSPRAVRAVNAANPVNADNPVNAVQNEPNNNEPDNNDIYITKKLMDSLKFTGVALIGLLSIQLYYIVRQRVDYNLLVSKYNYYITQYDHMNLNDQEEIFVNDPSLGSIKCSFPLYYIDMCLR